MDSLWSMGLKNVSTFHLLKHISKIVTSCNTSNLTKSLYIIYVYNNMFSIENAVEFIDHLQGHTNEFDYNSR